MAISATIAAVGAAGTYAMGHSANKAQKQQDRAQAQAQKNAETAAQEADRANNRNNQRRPDIIGLLGANMSANNMGFGSTFLTGAGGTTPPAAGTIGKNTLLGR